MAQIKANNPQWPRNMSTIIEAARKARDGERIGSYLFPDQARTSDPSTSKSAARKSTNQMRWDSQAMKLLRSWNVYGWLTDEEAAGDANLQHVGYWKRCSDLRNAGLIEMTPTTRMSKRTGEEQHVSRITHLGRHVVATSRMAHERKGH